MDIAVIGTGYVGLVTGTCFAEIGHNVYCVDIDESKINNLNQGIIPIYEPGLEELVRKNYRDGRLKFTTDFEEAIQHSLFVFIAVGTPPGEDGSADLSHVLSVAKQVGAIINGYKVIVNKSTVPVGTAKKVKERIVSELEQRGVEGIEFDVVSNPEFLKEGAAIDDFMKPDRIVIGTDNVRTGELMKELYAPFIRNGHPVIVMDVSSAEITKYAANCMLATRISFMNEIARVCDSAGADIEKVRLGIGSDSRIGMSFLYPGIGYGGSCFPKDVQAMIRTADKLNVETNILNAVELVNKKQKKLLAQWIVEKYGDDLSNYTFAIWGLAFKPKTDDMREAPSVELIQALIERGAKIKAHDPVAIEVAKKTFGPHESISYFENHYDALLGADALLLITEWNNYRSPDYIKMKKLLNNAVIFDGRNQYDPHSMVNNGFEYYCIGRSNHNEQ
ncbi:UDP-glucose/GDP-mannose dehydrogenase family protein [Anaerospora sp.]|uniref:UDP-glucose dehydrogenase family protein n=1 Tax=Anaerospora sp. TaxID=1960278 RepID=UPI00289E2A9F|nr:UDP-glucose/GDP-mannose dehydrogenase family protein [Anaerospora sp.]